MQSVNFDGLERLDDDFKNLLDEMPEMRKGLHGHIAEAIKDEVDAQIAGSGINDSNGHVKDWQEAHVGSGGGYAAVRPVKGSTGDNSPGAITNYLENGHRIREPSGQSKNYRPHIKKPYVDGYHFYQSASAEVEAKVITIAEEFAEEIGRKLEG